jgi:hypothetical protein
MSGGTMAEGEELTPELLRWSANDVLTRHSGGRRCRECRPAGCPAVAWAHQMLAELEAAR